MDKYVNVNPIIKNFLSPALNTESAWVFIQDKLPKSPVMVLG